MSIRSTALALLAALAVAGCGSDEEGKQIPAGIAATLQQRLGVIQSQLDQGGGACADILDKTQPVVERDLDQIPNDVDADVRSALRASFDRLFELASSQCDESAGQETTPTQPETTPEPTPTEPEQTQTEQTQTQETETQPAPDGGGTPPGQQKPKKSKGKAKGNDGGGAPAPEGD